MSKLCKKIHYDVETAREIVMYWFQRHGKMDFTSDDVADILDEFEDSVDEIVSEDGIDELELYLTSKQIVGGVVW